MQLNKQLNHIEYIFHYHQNSLVFDNKYIRNENISYEVDNYKKLIVASSVLDLMNKRKSCRKKNKNRINNIIFPLITRCLQKKLNGNYTYPIGGRINELAFFIIVSNKNNYFLIQYHQSSDTTSIVFQGNFSLFFDTWANKAKFALIICRNMHKLRSHYRNSHKLCLIESGTVAQNISLLLTEKNINHCLYGDINEIMFYELIKSNMYLPLITMIIP